MASEMANDAENGRRSFWRRPKLTVGLLILAVAGGFAGRTAVQSKRQKDAVAEIYRLGGTVAYGFKDSRKAMRDQQPVPYWLAEVLGPDMLYCATLVFFPMQSELHGTEAELNSAISRLQYLESVQFEAAKIDVEIAARLKMKRPDLKIRGDLRDLKADSWVKLDAWMLQHPEFK